MIKICLLLMCRRLGFAFGGEGVVHSSGHRLAHCGGYLRGQANGRLPPGAPAERVEEPAAVGGRSRIVKAGLTYAGSPSLRRGVSFGLRCQPFPPPGGGLLHGNFSLDPPASRRPTGFDCACASLRMTHSRGIGSRGAAGM